MFIPIFPDLLRDNLLAMADAAERALRTDHVPVRDRVTHARIHSIASRFERLDDHGVHQFLEHGGSDVDYVVYHSINELLTCRDDLPRCLAVELVGDNWTLGIAIGAAIRSVEHYAREKRDRVTAWRPAAVA